MDARQIRPARTGSGRERHEQLVSPREPHIPIRRETLLLQHCRVVLVGPMFGGNVGASARAIKNTGLGPLHLVAPTYRDVEEAIRFSHGAEEVLEAAERHETLISAIAGAERIVGFTARERHRRAIRPVRTFAHEWVAADVERRAPVALLFGRERDGLTNAELDHCTDLVWIPAHPEHPSYNLAQAVLIVGYELLVARADLDPELPRLHPRRTKRPSPAPMADAETLDAMQAHLREAFLAIGYARAHTADALVRSWHEIFARARLHRREAHMVRGLAQQVLWAASQLPEPLRRSSSDQTDEEGSGDGR